MIKTSLITLILMLILIARTGVAQTTEKLSLQDCIQIALEKNYSLKTAELQVKTAEKDVVSARSSWLPQVNSSFSFGKYVQGRRVVKEDYPVGLDPVTGGYIFEEKEVVYSRTERNSYNASVSLDQNIYDFGLTGNNIRQAKAFRNSYEHNLFDTRNLVIANVGDKFYQLLKSIRLRDVYAEAAHHAEENLQYNLTMLDVGLKSQAEIYQARVNLGNQKTQLINQNNTIEFAKAQLNNAMGRSAEEYIEITDEAPLPIFPEYDFSQAVQIAMENNEKLKSINEQIKASEYAIGAAKARFAPSIGARLNYNRSNDDIDRVYSPKLDEDFTATIGAGINLNIFSGLADKAALQRSMIQNQMELENLKEQKRLLITDINEYFLMLKAYADLININRENLAAYEENLRLQQEKRRVGSGTELEVMQAQVDVVQAKETLIRAEYDATTARVYLQAALGVMELDEQ
ncbi:MAG: TolC family protein [Calditrichaeota bacterium]|nr:MAG: TolC family protein [Calditrichota bacterium]